MDLWADPKHRQAFREKYKREIGPPTTWGEFSDIAEFFHSEGQAGQPAPSLPPLPERAEELDYLFHSVAAPYARRAVFQGESRPIIDEELFSYHYNLKTGEPRIDQPGFVYALHLLQKLQEFRPAQSVTQPAQAFANGQAVLCIADASWIARFRKNLPAASIGICAVPGSDRCFRFRDGKEQPQPNGNPVPYVGAGGWVAVVPRPAPHAATAFALFSELSNRTTSMQVVFEPQWGGGVYREEHFRANWQGFELDRAMTTLLPEVVRQTVARPGLKNPAVRLRIPDQRSHQEALVEEVRKALTQNQDARAALQRVARRWSELDRAKNPAQRKNEYLLSLGLTPQ
jgi:multiple sugar transport system substrate-binding protein